ncbi:MAG TPA: hypothetical protein VKZ96_02930 [Thermomicrobiales bacterium]|nr:hypothetical protein [Thermomicrobiales bacterium]
MKRGIVLITELLAVRIAVLLTSRLDGESGRPAQSNGPLAARRSRSRGPVDRPRACDG